MLLKIVRALRVVVRGIDLLLLLWEAWVAFRRAWVVMRGFAI